MGSRSVVSRVVAIGRYAAVQRYFFVLVSMRTAVVSSEFNCHSLVSIMVYFMLCRIKMPVPLPGMFGILSFQIKS